MFSQRLVINFAATNSRSIVEMRNDSTNQVVPAVQFTEMVEAGEEMKIDQQSNETARQRSHPIRSYAACIPCSSLISTKNSQHIKITHANRIFHSTSGEERLYARLASVLQDVSAEPHSLVCH